jgi:hypothetical protein
MKFRVKFCPEYIMLKFLPQVRFGVLPIWRDLSEGHSTIEGAKKKIEDFKNIGVDSRMVIKC